jgi:peptidoglycan hydrolase CwlO-like protein
MQEVTETLGPDRRTDRPGIYRTAEGFLINKDNDALAAYKKRKRKEQAVDRIQNQIDELKTDINEIKDLLKGLARR